MKNVINFFELAATFPRSDGRVTAQYCRRASHNRYIFPTIRRKQRRERAREKKAIIAKMPGSPWIANDTSVICLICYEIY